jgi:dTDP-4-dehydrorhamnose reductase
VRILILGGAGMLGHKLYQVLSSRDQTFVTVRQSARRYAPLELFAASSVIDGVDVTQPDHLHRAFAVARPEAVVNCVGIIKQLKVAHDPIPMLTINSLLPHRLAALSAACGARFVHISTDCVFSGAGGPYTEESVPDAADLYGRTKLLGETDEPNAVTLRTSIIGRELETSSGLVEWFLSQRGGRVRGFKHAQFTGLTTVELSRTIEKVLFEHERLQGLWQVSSDPITKYDLLQLVNRAFDADVTIDPEEEFFCDRRLDSSRFREATGYAPPSWPEMVETMHNDAEPYVRWRGH